MKEYSEIEKGYLQKGKTVIGADESGAGCLFGPLVVCAVFIPPDCSIDGINDSKKLTPKKREVLYKELINHPGVVCSVCIIPNQEIDQENIFQSRMRGFSLVIQKLREDAKLTNVHALVDGNALPQKIENLEMTAVVKGDTFCYSIAAASIVAKVVHDRIVVELDAEYPQYGLCRNKGYGTSEHFAALEKFGPTKYHRHSFSLSRKKTQAVSFPFQLDAVKQTTKG